LVAALSATVDVLVVDTPPLAVTTEALEFVPEAKVVVLVGRVGRTTMTGAQRAGELARFGGADQIAIALSDTGSARLSRNRYYDYYGGGRRRRGRRREEEGGPIPAAADAPADEAESLTGAEPGGPENAPSKEPASANGSPTDEWLEVDELIQRDR
jgi:Mrp family chromosome partitioning ATPase